MSEASRTRALDGGVAPAGLYTEIQQFYARQTGLLDEGRAVEWAETFTETAAFRDASRPQEALVGHRALGARAQAHHDRLTAEGIDVRHWLGMIDVRADGDGGLRVRSYALTPSTGRDGRGPRISTSVVCHDRLVRDAGRWRVADRTLRCDGTAFSVTS
ncbi:nuclear transport factor 2 family protein [Streptomyces scabiei]|uniref:nuclear transport factor 2 family protein n=1 Tax=Streptomyces scabiei TaxID=1930 RepID=UPI00298F4F5F|nr:nuclear transport factor 2 family protein [Streptomyces scabiei]MDW8805238.1 nuclear transport factor 2 family protein [Streptomyces scabiei]